MLVVDFTTESLLQCNHDLPIDWQCSLNGSDTTQPVLAQGPFAEGCIVDNALLGVTGTDHSTIDLANANCRLKSGLDVGHLKF
ncbi:hypothetical protein N7517_011282 [Penicillium concentricum]|uniref:Uncharacterized protein n=1 Tax=Penicillium concentricum TaxID=293559 RepID=A0A9W9RAR5_9EURO|nr:uncharacterized protein N7517_011282 [Penicillium concentricum]KAJ5356673.1 hypothetical protein N7517_011282 [Penicillium concentricum]